VLYISTDYFSGSIGVDWLEVDRIESIGDFQVTLQDGKRLSGTIEKGSADELPDKDFRVSTPEREVRTAARAVVNIESQKPNFWRQLTGSVDFGIDFTSGNSQTSVNSDAGANYLSTKWMGAVSFTSSFSGQSGASKANLIEVQTLDGVFLNRNSFLMGLGDFLHSSQQNLTLRTTLGGG